MLRHDAAPHEPEIRDDLLDLRSRGLGDAFGVVEHVGHRAGRNAGTTGDVDQLRALVAPGPRGLGRGSRRLEDVLVERLWPPRRVGGHEPRRAGGGELLR
jgi:hypothetical protein